MDIASLAISEVAQALLVVNLEPMRMTDELSEGVLFESSRLRRWR